jgi:multidrug efflux pump subunit AcrA (membrane-fusion protein)
MTRKKVYLGAGAVALAIALAITLEAGDSAVSAGDEPAQERAGAEGSESEGGMAGMGGMAMSMDGSVRLSAEDVRTFGITFGTAEVRSLQKAIRTTGLVEFDETRMAYVAPKFGGWAERLHVDFTGEPVRAGQPLLDVYSPDLVTAQEELLLAARMAESVGGSAVEGVADGARDLLESAKRRLRYWDIPEAEIRRILETGEVRRTLTLHAPVSGIVMEKGVVQGQAFRPGTNLYMIADLSTVWVNAEVFEADAALVREGMPAEIRVAALPGRVFTGRVEYVYPTVGERTRSMKARISLPNPRAELKPGMYATVTFAADLDEALAVPASAVLHTGERAVAFVDMGSGRLMPHELTLGMRGEDHVQVLDGLDPGQRVVTSAQFLLDSESNLAEVMKAMMAQMNMSDMGGMEMDTGSMEMEGTGGMAIPGDSMAPMDTGDSAMPDTTRED